MFFGKKKLPAVERFMRAEMKIDFDFEGYSKHHIFNNLSANSEFGFYYFPYGYLFRYPRWGKINELGFRQEASSHKALDTYSDKFRICLFGGSNAFSILVKDSKTFAQKLENLLNADDELKKKIGKNFKILNFSQPGNTMLNQIFNYIMFGSLVKPDLVISHGGACDFNYGQISDPFLLNNYNITYVEISETWSKIVHESDKKIEQDFCDEKSGNFVPVRVKNFPDKIIDSYHQRMIQFKNLVESNSTKFINSLEPILYSKKSHSNEEKKNIKNYNKYYGAVYNNLLKLFDDYQKKYLEGNLEFNVNLHKEFNKLDSSITHFGDVVHTVETGEEIIANMYYKKIQEIYLN